MWNRSPGNRHKACLLESSQILCKSHSRDRRQELPMRRATPYSPTQHMHYPPLGRRKKAHSFTRSYSALKKKPEVRYNCWKQELPSPNQTLSGYKGKVQLAIRKSKSVERALALHPRPAWDRTGEKEPRNNTISKEGIMQNNKQILSTNEEGQEQEGRTSLWYTCWSGHHMYVLSGPVLTTTKAQQPPAKDMWGCGWLKEWEQQQTTKTAQLLVVFR